MKAERRTENLQAIEWEGRDLLKEIRELREVIDSELTNSDINNVIKLARRTLHIALCWNDHNFKSYHELAKDDVLSAGIDNIEDANKWLQSLHVKIENALKQIK